MILEREVRTQFMRYHATHSTRFVFYTLQAPGHKVVEFSCPHAFSSQATFSPWLFSFARHSRIGCALTRLSRRGEVV